ncbi:MAG: asparaginase domain-containing protein [Candidatus Daviesbacteria bacterium]|nr:asparaginase domain-containing protein [Candidatus Daviesbacteria bacterium]
MNNIKKVIFFNLGGTWDMVKKNGKLTGSRSFNDEALYQLEESLKYYKNSRKDIDSLELQLVKLIEKSIVKNAQKSTDLGEYLNWVPGIDKYVKGKFISLFEGDSSHLRAALIAPFVAFILGQYKNDPHIQILGSQGTDTADCALLPLLDVYLFDTSFLPILFTGSNRTKSEWNSDAPKNFSDLVKLAGTNLAPGSYWVFAGHLYRASDFIKIDPLESRRIENYSTFFAPRLTTRFTKKFIDENSIFNSESGNLTPIDHISQNITTENLYHALTQVEIVDLGNQNNISSEIEKILNPNHKAIVIAGHSLGNASNPIRYACVQAALQGKLVIIVSRTLIGEVNERYAASILGADSEELMETGKLIISGHKLNKNVAKAIVTRAVQEKLNQKQTQALINSYCKSRGLLS